MRRSRKYPVFSTGQILLTLFAIIGVLYYLENKKSFEFGQLQIPTIPIMEIIVIAIGVLFFTLIAFNIVLYFKNKAEKEKLRALEFSAVDHMSGVEFEQYVGQLLKFIGFSVHFTPTSSDFGVDIIAENRKGKFAVQVKRYAYPVDRKAVSDAVAGMNYYHCNRMMVITNNHFTPGAVLLAHANDCILVDRDLLANWILAFKKNRAFHLSKI